MDLVSQRRSRNASAFLLAAVVTVASMVGLAPTSQAASESKTLLTPDTTWTYLDDGTEPSDGTAWATTDFNPGSNWKTDAGKFGAKRGKLAPLSSEHTPTVLLNQYLPGGNENIPGFFFRTEVDLTADQAQSTALSGVLSYDDSITVYVNGKRIAGADDEDIKAWNSYGGSNKSAPQTFNLADAAIEGSPFVEGKNVIGVEVHNGRPTSSDIWFAVDKDVVLGSTTQAPTIKELSMQIGSDQHDRIFTWVSDETEQERLQLALAPAKDDDPFPTELIADEPASTSTIDKEQFSDYVFHRSDVKGLKPNTKYVYRAGSERGWSKTYSFTTDSMDPTKDFTFLMVGDPQIGASGRFTKDPNIHGDWWVKTMERAQKAYPNSSMLLSLGDQINGFDDYDVLGTQYENFYRPDILRTQPLVTTIGNHDISPIYENFFGRPNVDKQYGAGNPEQANGDYWFKFNGILFVNINSNDLNYDGANGHIEYLRKIDAEHGKDPDVRWKFVIQHHNMFSNASHSRDKNIREWRKMIPVVSELGFAGVLNGHDHVYTRAHLIDPKVNPVDADRTDDKALSEYHPQDGEGFYLTANSGSGSKFYDEKPTDWDDVYKYVSVHAQTMTPNYTAVKVSNDKITFSTFAQAVRSDGPVEKVDEVTLYQVDKTAPTFKGVEDTEVEQGASFDPMAGVSVADDLDGDIDAANIKVDGDVDTTQLGDYEVTYEVTDKAGNTAKAVRKVTVVEKKETPSPTPAPSESESATPSPSESATPAPSESATASPAPSESESASPSPSGSASTPSAAPATVSSSVVVSGGSAGQGYRPAALPKTGV
ncbi:DUF5011 domain-containing protein [Cutibacterium equinum]|uniref:DUF5011 domain-containing protein n=1 Tax=Cutibacterium equinum TaxID=3016342 RepID=A0ABY7QZ04_9ACTN|nr:immunoglobulin-like domain-containing protein [Cutibacterium equinum]WCC79694.1 DUF5011 domain-containing protein [Cutibacterium equinum]